MSNYCECDGLLRISYVVFAFCAALFIGALKGVLVGLIAGLIVIVGNVAIILGLFPVNFAWTFYTIVHTNRFDVPLKIAILLCLPALAAIWLALSITGSVIGGVGYGFFTPCVSSFEAFRHENESHKFLHCIVGWQRLTHDLISRQGPFLETACIPVVGLTILLWPLFVVESIVLAIFSSVFVGLYGSIVVYQERSFRRGLAYVIAMVAEFDEYTNDWLYLREGTILPKPRYRKKQSSSSSDLTVGQNRVRVERISSDSVELPPMLMPSLGPSRSVRETIQEVKMVQGSKL